jgi:vacuolar-type H+-ATPase subunit E/Vma4
VSDSLLPLVPRLRAFAQQKASPMVADILNEAADALEEARKERDQAQRNLADCVRTRDTGGKLYG